MSNAREQLIQATKDLLWERGYEAMSPNHVLDRSGLGKGSMYHHFKSKKALCQAAIEERAEELHKEFDAEFNSELPLLERFRSYLCKERNGIKGCRLGRIVSDVSISDDELRQPIANLFKYIEDNFIAALREAQSAGEVELKGDPEAIAAALIATVQGGFTLSRSYQNADHIQLATRGAMQLLENSIMVKAPAC